MQQTSTLNRGEWIYIKVTLDVPLPSGKQQVKMDDWRLLRSASFHDLTYPYHDLATWSCYNGSQRQPQN